MSEKAKSDQGSRELAIVRKFLQRNNLQSLVQLLKKASDPACGAKITRGAMDVPMGTHTSVSFTNTDWDSDGFFQAGHPTRLTVPEGLGGRYLIQVAIRWLNEWDPAGGDPPADSYYYAYVMLNGTGHPAGNDARSTANDVEGGATGTTQHFVYETDLAEGSYAELWLWQEYEAERRCDVYFQMRRVGS